MARKNTTTSKKTGPPRQVKLSDGSVVMEQYHNQYMSKSVYKDPVKDSESGKTPKDKASKHPYPPPKKNPVFREKWMKFIEGLMERDNFKIAHLEVLEVLCDLYVEYDNLTKYIRTHGQTYEVVSRFGKMRKPHPEVILLEKVKANIRAYTTRLDLFPKRDHSKGSGGDGDDWK